MQFDSSVRDRRFKNLSVKYVHNEYNVKDGTRFIVCTYGTNNERSPCESMNEKMKLDFTQQTLYMQCGTYLYWNSRLEELFIASNCHLSPCTREGIKYWPYACSRRARVFDETRSRYLHIRPRNVQADIVDSEQRSMTVLKTPSGKKSG